MIGDTSFDMEMARNAGVAAVAVTWEYHDRRRWPRMTRRRPSIIFRNCIR